MAEFPLPPGSTVGVLGGGLFAGGRRALRIGLGRMRLGRRTGSTGDVHVRRRRSHRGLGVLAKEHGDRAAEN